MKVGNVFVFFLIHQLLSFGEVVGCDKFTLELIFLEHPCIIWTVFVDGLKMFFLFLQSALF